MNNDKAYPPMPTGTSKDRMTDEEWREVLNKEGFESSEEVKT